MPDYVALAATAKRLVEDSGRAVSLVRLEDAPADPAKPWRGPTDPRSPAEATVAAHAVFVPPSSAVSLGIATADSDFVKRSDAIAILTLDTAAPSEPRFFDELVDGSTRWRILRMDELRPANTTLVYFASLAR